MESRVVAEEEDSSSSYSEDEDEMATLSTVKSSAGPYISEERDVLQNINLVRAMKERFQ